MQQSKVFDRYVLQLHCMSRPGVCVVMWPDVPGRYVSSARDGHGADNIHVSGRQSEEMRNVGLDLLS